MKMKINILWVTILASNLISTSLHATIITNFIKYDGITYYSNNYRYGRELRDEDLGPEVTKVKFKLVRKGDRPRKPPAYGPKEAYAASLEIGTPIYRVKNYASTFRLAARNGSKIILFDAVGNQNARKGGDLLDLKKVNGIQITGDERTGVIEQFFINTPEQVSRLVEYVIHAPIRPTPDRSGPRYFITFLFIDGTATRCAYFLNSRELSRNIILPHTFASALTEAMNYSFNAPNSRNSIELSKHKYDRFPKQFSIANRVFQYVYRKKTNRDNPVQLNPGEKALFLHFVFEGLVDNSGLYSILLETKGEFTQPYLEVLRQCESTRSSEIVEQIHNIYEKYFSDFSKAAPPPELIEGSPKFDGVLSKQIDDLQKEWYSLSDLRKQQVYSYIETNKDQIVRIQD